MEKKLRMVTCRMRKRTRSDKNESWTFKKYNLLHSVYLELGQIFTWKI